MAQLKEPVNQAGQVKADKATASAGTGVTKPHQIEMAKVFHPSEEEFNDPLGYINKIRPVAELYGICKIVPPKFWKPKFCLDMDTFKFTPRVQRLNELEAGTRIKLNFLDKLSKFWELQGQKFKIPTLERKQVDLFKLNKLVDGAGGFENLIKTKKWNMIAKELGLKEPTSSRNIKIHYEKILYPFLLFESGVTIPTNPVGSNNTSNNMNNKRASDIESDICATPTKGSPSKKAKKTKTDPGTKRTSIESINCLVCERGDDEAMMLLCDGCDDSYHTYCLFPPLKEIPKGDWRCPLCVSEICKKPTDSYGFTQSKQRYSLNEFGQMAHKFKSDYFDKPHDEVTLDEVEEEFWKILSNPDEQVEVEYGADLHTLDTGSGFPTRSYKGKLNSNNMEYLEHPWNLNNLSRVDKSVLSQMNVEISGMKVPWAYVGMCFSCFCWHVEDHWSYSVNYLHWGAPKTWYGVSGQYAEKFEECMRKNAHELFDKSPDLLHHLVTIMNPAILQEYGVPIYKIHQNVGEFVVTFPRAYHAGFNQGFNFAEAVNFCPADWMRLGRAAIENYKQMKRHTVFSHDELVFKIATSLKLADLDIIDEIKKELALIIEEEKKVRWELSQKKLFKKSNKIAFELLGDDERTCEYCKTTCFTSAIYCSCLPNKLTCLSHYEHLCKPDVLKDPTDLACVTAMRTPTKRGSPTKRTIQTQQSQDHKFTLIYRYTTDEMVQILTRLNTYTSDYDLWCRTVESILNLRDLGTKLVSQSSNANTSIDVIDLETEGENDCFKRNKKPKLKKLLELLEQAKVNNYPRVKVESKLSANAESINLLAELEAQYKLAQQSAEYCNQFINLYKRNFKTLNHNKIDLDQITDFKGVVAKVEADLEATEMELGCEENSDEDVVFIKKTRQTNNSKRKISIERLRSLVGNLGQLVCELDEQALLISIYDEALEYERKVDRLISEWNVESPNQLKRVLNYIARIDIEFASVKVEQLKVMHRQALWLQSVNVSVQNPSELTLSMISDLIDKVLEDSLLNTYTDNAASKQVVEKTFVDLQELLSISQTWDNKAKEQLGKTKSKLEDLELILSEAKCIPAYMEHVEQLTQVVDQAKVWNTRVDKVLYYDKSAANAPYLSTLIELLEQAQQLPVKLQTNLVQMKVDLMNEWNQRVHKLFTNSPTTCPKTRDGRDYQSERTASAVLEILTPRLDINSVLSKLQASNGNTDSSKVVDTKRSKCKQVVAKGSQVAEDGDGSAEQTNCTANITASDIYSEDKSFQLLREHLHQFELNELIQLKKLRSFNGGQLSAWQAMLTSQAVEGVEEVRKHVKQHVKMIKCSSCYKAVNLGTQSSLLRQCRLCLGVFHVNNSCKSASNKSNSDCKTLTGKQSSTISDYLKQEETSVDLCTGCRRSKRPSLEQVLENIVTIEKLEVKSYESDSLQVFVERVLNWQERFKKLFENAELKEIYGLVKKPVKNANGSDAETTCAETNDEIKKLYDELPTLKRVELNEFYIESLLLEIDLEETRLLHELFGCVGEDELKRLETELSKQSDSFLEAMAENNSEGSASGDEVAVSPTKGAKKVTKAKLVAGSKKGDSLGLRANMKSLKVSAAGKADRLGSSKAGKLVGAKKEVVEAKPGQKRTAQAVAASQKLLSKKASGKSSNKNLKAKKEEPVCNSEIIDSSMAEAGEESDASNEEFCAAVDCTEPLGDNIKWVQCDGSCDRWFHMICVGLTKIRKKETYLCESCTEPSTVMTSSDTNAERPMEGVKAEAKTEPVETLVEDEAEPVIEAKMEVDQCD